MRNAQIRSERDRGYSSESIPLERRGLIRSQATAEVIAWKILSLIDEREVDAEV